HGEEPGGSLAGIGGFLHVEHFLEFWVARVASGAGFLIMAAGEFDARGLLGKRDDGQAVVSAGVAGVELNGFAQGGFAGGALALFAEGEAEKVLDLRILGIKFGGAAEGVEGIVVFFLAEFQLAEDQEAESVSGG